MRVLSHTLKLQGACDVVEFKRSSKGVPIYGHEGLWLPMPVEYKHGKAGVGTEADSLQLCAQAICLEEMLLCKIENAAIFYQTPKRRENIVLDEELRRKTYKAAEEMNDLFKKGYTPKVRKKKACVSCSLNEICLPSLLGSKDVDSYVNSAIREVNNT